MENIGPMKSQLAAAIIAMGLMLLSLFALQSAAHSKASYGGVVLIGPIPIVFGSSPQMAIAAMLLAIALIAVSFLLLIRPMRRTDQEECHEEERSAQIKGGAVVMIGPIPLVIGSDSKTALFMMLIALTITIIWALAKR